MATRGWYSHPINDCALCAIFDSNSRLSTTTIPRFLHDLYDDSQCGRVPTGTSVWTGLEDGLQANDHIIGIDGEILGEGREDYENARQDFKAIISTKAVGDDITILFERRERDGIDVDYCGEAINGIANVKSQPH
jgi:hypothetical protein